ncbi:hypothetical protein FH972_019196 [Carpinus fangiana]|uniref:Uncharacterized protein n=1 Tax=Carpinus fangiana TaxID=176857 RepID=A0A5N6RQW7_9ROSI|nr:hypothetical protein FH972_019196 [Carpinus fangiana]
MATILVAVFLLVSRIHLPPTSASLPYGGRKSLSLDGLTTTVPKLQGSYEGFNLTSKKMVYFRSLKEGGGTSKPPSPKPNQPHSYIISVPCAPNNCY